MVDEILRTQIGIDFETAAAVQRYIRQLLDTWKGGAQSERLKANRRRLRGEIVRCAQAIWDKTVLNGEELIVKTGDAVARRNAITKMIVVHSRERWAPASLLPTFLFPARLLPSSNARLAYDHQARWLADPTLDLETSRGVLRVGADWIHRKAGEMLQNLVVHKHGAGVTTWIQAAEEWHSQRIKQDLYSGKYLNLEHGGARLDELRNPATASNNRLDVIAKKLRIDPLFPIGTLTEQEKRMAVACFIKIVRERCAGCPLNNLLVLPSGLEEIVRHHREWHAHDFWLNDGWTIRG
jgi:hypothetical protein